MAMLAGVFRSSALRRAAPAVLRPTTFARPMLFRGFSDVVFMKTHEWIKTEAGVGTLGITDFAQGQLGEVVYCDLPEVGAKFKGKDTICTLESVKAVGEVYAPADCEVVEVNETLADVPATVNSSPESKGWLMKVKFSGEMTGTLDRKAYDVHVEAEAKEEH
mmetsp:Transcript_65920/g.214550  ORF Transcript_65920/g.214550 Transcript_65920/m.214550 type:complete len:162 (-) Transcript_65920:333-818(-)